MSFKIEDSSYLWGDGLFETLEVRDGRLISASRHLRRLGRALEEFAYPLGPLHVEGYLEPGGLDDGLLRVTVSRSGRITTRWRERPGPSSIRAMTMPGWYDPSDAIAEYKTTSYLKRLEIRRRARAAGYDDGIATTRQGRVGEASMANIFLRFDETIVTPLVEGLLPGVTRERVIDAAGAHGISLEERAVDVEELQFCDAVVLTSAGVGAAPVVAVDDRDIPESQTWAQQVNAWLTEVE